MHIFKEMDQKFQCPYCAVDLRGKSWESEFPSKAFYKTFTCGCGKKLNIKIEDFLSSGHDSWDGTEAWRKDTLSAGTKDRMSSIEEKLDIIQEFKKHS